MTSDPNPARFYDELADEYHLIFADWDAAIAWQQRLLAGLLRDLGLTDGTVLDASCGIGTHALALARAGFSVTATDISRASVERCAREASARGPRRYRRGRPARARRRGVGQLRRGGVVRQRAAA